MSIDNEAMTRVQKARAELILTRRFYGVLVSNVEPVISRKFPTAATNGRQHFWNPEFVMTLTHAELLGVQAHECEHDARHHGTRRASRDPVEWNVAGDFSINLDLIAEGFTLPKGALLDAKYKGMASEDIYRSRELDKKQPEPEPEDGDDDADGDDTGDEDSGDEGDAGENADTNPGKGEDEGDDAGDAEGDSQEAGDEGDGAEGQGGDEAGDEPAEGAGEAAGEAGEAGEGEATGESGDAPGEAGTGAGEAGEGEAKEGQGSSGDPGGCGEVLDSEPEDGAPASEDDGRWERIVRQAASMAKAVGQCPGHVTREIERANNPTRDWRDELREFAEQGALRVETWNRPNRRFVGHGLTLPSTKRDGVNKAVFIIDTSGSCDDVALACVRDEAQAMLDDGVIEQVVAVYGDVRVCRVDEYRTGEEIEFDPRGGLGTDMEPLFDFVAQEHEDATLIVCFTDLGFYKTCGDEPHCPVLFAVHGYPQYVKAKIAAGAPWDARCIDVGAH